MDALVVVATPQTLPSPRHPSPLFESIAALLAPLLERNAALVAPLLERTAVLCAPLLEGIAPLLEGIAPLLEGIAPLLAKMAPLLETLLERVERAERVPGGGAALCEGRGTPMPSRLSGGTTRTPPAGVSARTI